MKPPADPPDCSSRPDDQDDLTAAPVAEGPNPADDVTDRHPNNPDGHVDSGEQRTTRRRFAVRARWVAALVLAAAVTLCCYQGWLLYRLHQNRTAQAEAVEAARNFTLALTTLDPASIDENFGNVEHGATGEFKDMFTASSAQLRQALIDNKASAQGNVLEAAVKSAIADRVEVVLFVDQSVRNNAVPQAQLDRSRVTMTMQKVDGRWLASKVQLS
ncbi:Mce protein [Mycolicibacterium cosmeticum]|uniref:Mce protein n=1 Tax=Mycolicibacterium cosmeticum TaxID=258533 RepID=UPI003204E78C